MAHKVIDFGPGGQRLLGTYTIETKVNWTDPWEEEPDLRLAEVTWSKAPALPVATVFYDYGFLKMEYETSLGVKDVKRYNRRFIRIVVGTEEGKGIFPTRDPNRFTGEIVWIGYIDIDEQRDMALASGQQTGVQAFGCYGLERLLAKHELKYSWWYGNTPDGLGVRMSELPYTFNNDETGERKGNRTPDKHDGSYVFEQQPENARFWTSADVAEYLVKYQTPRDNTGAIKIPFELDAGFETKIPSWDEPILPTEGATTYSLLSQVIPLHRLLMWHVEVDETASPNKAIIKIDTATAADVILPLPGDPKIPANPNTRDINFAIDQMTNGAVKHSGVKRYDEVIAEGALKVSVATFNKAADGTIDMGWDAFDQAEYEAGASSNPNWPNWGPARREKETSIVRAKSELEKVYSYFEIKSDWNQRTGNGEGGITHATFVTGDPHAGGVTAWYNVCYSQMYILPQLPLKAGVKYFDDNIKNGTYDETGERANLGPLVWFKDPSSKATAYARVETAGLQGDIEDADVQDNSWSASVAVPPKTRYVVIRVNGADQYAIAYGDHTILTGVDREFGQHKWEEAIFTLALTDHRRVEGRWPAAPPVQDVILTKRLRSPGSEKFQEIYVVPDTVVATNNFDGTLRRSTGGYIRRPKDANKQLEAVATVAGAYYTIEHKIVNLTSYRIQDPTDLWIGNQVTTVEGDIVANSTISQIRVNWQMGDATNQGNPDPTWNMVTWAGELDAYQFEPIIPDTFSENVRVAGSRGVSGARAVGTGGGAVSP